MKKILTTIFILAAFAIPKESPAPGAETGNGGGYVEFLAHYAYDKYPEAISLTLQKAELTTQEKETLEKLLDYHNKLKLSASQIFRLSDDEKMFKSFSYLEDISLVTTTANKFGYIFLNENKFYKNVNSEDGASKHLIPNIGFLEITVGITQALGHQSGLVDMEHLVAVGKKILPALDEIQKKENDSLTAIYKTRVANQTHVDGRFIEESYLARAEEWKNKEELTWTCGLLLPQTDTNSDETLTYFVPHGLKKDLNVEGQYLIYRIVAIPSVEAKVKEGLKNLFGTLPAVGCVQFAGTPYIFNKDLVMFTANVAKQPGDLDLPIFQQTLFGKLYMSSEGNIMIAHSNNHNIQLSFMNARAEADLRAFLETQRGVMAMVTALEKYSELSRQPEKILAATYTFYLYEYQKPDPMEP